MEQLPLSPTPFLQAVAGLLKTRSFGRSMRGFGSVDSTNTVATAWAAEDAPEGSVVYAEFQTAGRGRMGRTWSATPGKNLTFSVILRPNLAPDQFGLIPLTAALAVAEAADEFTAPVSAEIKWPNDLLLEGRKCCGMLLESSTTGPSPRTVILGIGLNVNQVDFPPELADHVTSLLLATGRMADRAALFASILLQLERYYTRLPHDAANIRAAFTARLSRLGRPVTFRLTHASETVEGILEGVTDTGALVIRTQTGARIFHAGEITTQLNP